MELTENGDSKETEVRHITWTLSCLDGKVDPKAYEKLKSIAWSDIGDDGSMIFECSDAQMMSAFSKKIRAIFAQNEEDNTAEAFSFTIRPAKAGKAE